MEPCLTSRLPPSLLSLLPRPARPARQSAGPGGRPRLPLRGLPPPLPPEVRRGPGPGGRVRRLAQSEPAHPGGSGEKETQCWSSTRWSQLTFYILMDRGGGRGRYKTLWRAIIKSKHFDFFKGKNWFWPSVTLSIKVSFLCKMLESKFKLIFFNAPFFSRKIPGSIEDLEENQFPDRLYRWPWRRSFEILTSISLWENYSLGTMKPDRCGFDLWNDALCFTYKTCHPSKQRDHKRHFVWRMWDRGKYFKFFCIYFNDYLLFILFLNDDIHI